MDSVSPGARFVWNDGGTNLVRIADSGHSDFVLYLLHGVSPTLSSAVAKSMFTTMNQPVEAWASGGAQRLGETTGTEHGRIRGVLIFSICSLLHIGIWRLAVNPWRAAVGLQLSTDRGWRASRLSGFGRKSMWPSHSPRASATQCDRVRTSRCRAERRAR